jgi:hypothetical protein
MAFVITKFTNKTRKKKEKRLPFCVPPNEKKKRKVSHFLRQSNTANTRGASRVRVSESGGWPGKGECSQVTGTWLRPWIQRNAKRHKKKKNKESKKTDTASDWQNHEASPFALWFSFLFFLSFS